MNVICVGVKFYVRISVIWRLKKLLAFPCGLAMLWSHGTCCITRPMCKAGQYVWT